MTFFISKKMKKQKIIIMFFLLFSFYLWSNNSKRILIIHSYRPYYKWTQNIDKGIIDALEGYSKDLDIKVEYMDMLKANDKDHFMEFLSFKI